MRIERDSLGELEVPAMAKYGIHTMRAHKNFYITGVPLSEFPELVVALAQVKKAAAAANLKMGILAPAKASAISDACDEIIGGAHHDAFIVDMIQGGAGTSSNMNANELIANIALEKMGHALGAYQHLHPNDDVNKSQSTNDVYPTALRLSILANIHSLTMEQQKLSDAFEAKAVEFNHIHKVGRTQLQDAVPMTLGQEFRSFANTIEEDIALISDIAALLREVNLGGTAIGTSINTLPDYPRIAVEELSRVVGFDLKPARNLIEASSDLGAFVMFSGLLKRIAVKLSKICNDLRLLSSGPRAGFGEINLPPVQAGSSIMPGKVNPVIPEVVNQVAFQVIGNDLTVTMAAEAGQLQLNAFEPVAIFNILQSIRILKRAIRSLTDRCVVGISANEGNCLNLLNNSLVLATGLVPTIGYENAARIAKHALTSGQSVIDAAAELGFGSAAIDKVFGPGI